MCLSLLGDKTWQCLNFELCGPIATVFSKNKMLCIILFSVHLLCILALPCIIINEFYILIDKVKSKNSLTTPTRLSQKWKCELDFWGVCARACVCVWGARPWKLSVGEYWVNILNWTMLNCLAWKRMSGQAKGKILQPCQYLLKQAECEYFVLPPPSGTSFSV